MNTINVKLGIKPETRLSLEAPYVLIPICNIGDVNIGICTFFEKDVNFKIKSVKDLEDALKTKGDVKRLGWLKFYFDLFTWPYVSKRDSIAVLFVKNRDLNDHFDIRVNFTKGPEQLYCDFRLENIKCKDDFDVEYIKARTRSDYSFIDVDTFDKDLIDAIAVFIRNVKEIHSLERVTERYIVDNIEKIKFQTRSEQQDGC